MYDNSLVLTFDVGTQSARAVLVDPKGNILYKAQKQYEQPYYSKNPGWAEQRPDFYWEIICECSKSIREQCGERWKDIIAVTVTTIRATGICLDGEGKPLRDAIVWLDNRQARCEKKAFCTYAGTFQGNRPYKHGGASAQSLPVQLDSGERA